MPLALFQVVKAYPLRGILPEFSSILFYLTDYALLGTLILWLLGHWLEPARPLQGGPWFIGLPLGVLVGLSALSIGWAPARMVAAEVTLRLLAAAGLYLFVVNEVRDFRPAAWALLAGMVTQSVLAMLQFGLQRSLGLTGLGELGTRIDFPGLWVRGFGLSRHPNILGGYLLGGLAAAAALSLTETGWRRWAAGACFAVGLGGLLSTFSRSAWLGFGLGLGLAVMVSLLNHSWKSPPARRLWLLIALTGGVTAGYVGLWPDLFVSRLIVPIRQVLGLAPPAAQHVEMVNLDARAGYVAVARQLIAAHPLGGVGSGNFSVASYLLEPTLPAAHAYLPVHNAWLLVTSELGIPGGLAYCFLTVAWGVAGLRRWRALGRSAWLLAWTMLGLGLWVTGLNDLYIWGWQAGRLTFFAALGLWAVSWQPTGERQ